MSSYLVSAAAGSPRRRSSNSRVRDGTVIPPPSRFNNRFAYMSESASSDRYRLRLRCATHVCQSSGAIRSSSAVHCPARSSSPSTR